MSNRFSALRSSDLEFDVFADDTPAPAASREPASQATGQPAAPAPQTSAQPQAAAQKPVQSAPAQATPRPAAEPVSQSRARILEAKVALHRKMLEEFNLVALEKLPRDQLVGEIRSFVTDYVNKERLALNNAELEEFVGTIVDEMTGLGPLEAMMRNPDISDILINGC
jgi:pilus assembly protein CpaF